MQQSEKFVANSIRLMSLICIFKNIKNQETSNSPTGQRIIAKTQSIQIQTGNKI